MNELIQNILDETPYKTNPYFSALADGSFDKEDFVETQVQFYNAVVFFSRPMAALAAKIPTPELRMEVLRNVWEEHGEGNMSFLHGETFKLFLARLAGISEKDIESRKLWPELRIFNTALVGACVLDEYLIGAATLGIIERMFCDISFMLANGVIKRGWLKKEEIVHYNIHKDLDLKHAQDFFDVLEPSWKKGDFNRYLIEQGLRMGAVLFNGLYLGLYENRKRRLLNG
jgi:pyrroloquinoline-quinone synthase